MNLAYLNSKLAQTSTLTRLDDITLKIKSASENTEGEPTMVDINRLTYQSTFNGRELVLEPALPLVVHNEDVVYDMTVALAARNHGDYSPTDTLFVGDIYAIPEHAAFGMLIRSTTSNGLNLCKFVTFNTGAVRLRDLFGVDFAVTKKFPQATAEERQAFEIGRRRYMQWYNESI